MKKIGKPNLIKALRLKCPYCGATPLLRPGQFIEFRDGCSTCNYKYSREIGYFSGAAWMINYAVAALSAMIAGALMVWKYSDMGDLVVAGVPAFFGLVTSIVFIPFGRSLWMYIDHSFHPLTNEDRLDAQSS